MLAWLGCINPVFLDNGTPGAFRYVADRPTLVGVRMRPLVAAAGQEVTVEALLLGPEPASIAVDGCGWSLDRPTRTWCFEEPAFYEPLGDALPLTLSLPEWTTDGFEDCADPESWKQADTGLERPRDCWVRAEVRVQALGTDGIASAEVVPGTVVVGASVPAFAPSPPPTVTVPATATVSEEVLVDVWVPLLEDAAKSPVLDFATSLTWTVEGGELLGTGATSMRQDGTELHGQNRWVLPDRPGTYRIAAVAQIPRGPRPVYEQVWATASVEVSR